MMQKLLWAAFVCCTTLACTPKTEVSSPDGSIRLKFAADRKSGEMRYTVSVGDRPLFGPSLLGLEAAEADLAHDFRVDEAEYASVDEEWTQPWGENKRNRSRYNEMAVALHRGGEVRLTMRFRLFDDGLGFRYEYEIPACDSLVVTGELTEFRFAADGDTWTVPADSGVCEPLCRAMPLRDLGDADTPATFRVAGLYGSIHEAALYDYPEMTLRRCDSLAFRCDLAPLPDGTKARVAGRFVTPWRTVQLASEAVGLINSSLILNLNEPSKIGDTEWIRPMKCIGVRWPTPSEADSRTAEERYDAATEQVKRYLEFAADNRIDAVLIGRSEGREARDSARCSDCCGPYRDFDIAAIAGYARDLGIELIGCRGTDDCVSGCGRQLDSALMRYAGLGMHNLMTDFSGTLPDGCSRRSQYGVRHCRRVVEAAARHCMTVDMREPVKDCGIRRTWPNMMTRSYGCGDARCAGGPPSHGVMLPFTRLLAGPMGCASGTFDILSECARDSVRFGLRDCMEEAGMRVNSTLAGQIADWVILYSPLQMASDRIEHYEGHPAFRFFRDFDPDCDWSRALAGEPGEYVVVVRRAGDRFYFGAATNERPRTLHFELDFLEPEVTYEAAIYADAPDADWRTDPTACDVSVRYVTSADAIDVVLAPGGGQAISFLPL